MEQPPVLSNVSSRDLLEIRAQLVMGEGWVGKSGCDLGGGGSRAKGCRSPEG